MKKISIYLAVLLAIFFAPVNLSLAISIDPPSEISYIEGLLQKVFPDKKYSEIIEIAEKLQNLVTAQVTGGYNASVNIPAVAKGAIFVDIANPPMESNGLGKVVVTWNTSNTPTAQIYVSKNNGPDVLFAEFPFGSSTASWITPLDTFVFSMYEGTSKINKLGSVIVIGQDVKQTETNPYVISFSENPVPVPEKGTGLAKVTVSWNGVNYTEAALYVSVNGIETLFASGSSGSAEAPWITNKEYVFKLYDSTQKNTLLVEKTLSTVVKPSSISVTSTTILPNGTVIISWDAAENAKVVQVDGKLRKTIATGVSGTVTATRLAHTKSYGFYLYNSNESKLLDFVYVRGLNTTPPPIIYGGSNFSMYSLGTYVDDYKQNPNNLNAIKQSWQKPANLKHVVCLHHLDTNSMIPTILSKMRNSGTSQSQNQISLPIWFGAVDSKHPSLYEGCMGHLMNSSSGLLMNQHKTNLKNLLKQIKTAGFKQVVVRFAPQGVSSPKNWNSWDKVMYQKNFSYMKDIISVVTTELKGSGIDIKYDLGMEQAGIDLGKNKDYVITLWRDYTKLYGLNNTYGFSTAVASGRIINQYAWYDQTGKRPLYGGAFDIYHLNLNGEPTNHLKIMSIELAKVGAISLPIMIQETFHNNAEFKEAFKIAKERYNLNVQSFVQWPLKQEDYLKYGSVHFSLDSIASFSNYIDLIKK